MAYLNGNVKYLNVGTAPIYEVCPTLNFVLGIGELSNTIATIIAKSNTTANVILPGQFFLIKFKIQLLEIQLMILIHNQLN